ncbi:MAG: hypothetical protein LCI00_22780 [Chloroflexi bacterium]|nr:hypothetical protein [Chloroflexota bacterium]MCC6893197.1 hypothetical protein [Anaerolineae bacterium]
MTSDLDYRAIRKRVEEGVKRQKRITRTTLFVVNLCLYILFLIIGWGIFLSNNGAELSASVAVGQSDSPLIGAMIMLSMAGFLSLMFQAIGLSLDTKMGEESMREKLVAREINREMLKMGLDEADETDKRKGMMRLTDDGELETVDEVLAAEEEVLLKRGGK